MPIVKRLFFTGKGGVGKSTLAATAAWQLAQLGHKVLAVSFDPAHNLGDIFGRELSHAKLAFTDRLDLQEADLEQSAEAYIDRSIGVLSDVYSYTHAFNLDLYLKVLRYSPGVEEYAALTALERIVIDDTHYDYIVFDTPPTGLTLRILALPSITVAWIERLLKLRRQILQKRGTIHKLSGKYDEEGFKLPYTERDDTVLHKLEEMLARYRTLNDLLRGGDTHIAVVFNPDYLSFRESERIVSGLQELELPLRSAYNNKVEDENEEIAQDVEKKLFSNGARSVPIQRVPLQPPQRDGAYLMPVDITAAFV